MLCCVGGLCLPVGVSWWWCIHVWADLWASVAVWVCRRLWERETTLLLSFSSSYFLPVLWKGSPVAVCAFAVSPPTESCLAAETPPPPVFVLGNNVSPAPRVLVHGVPQCRRDDWNVALKTASGENFSVKTCLSSIWSYDVAIQCCTKSWAILHFFVFCQEDEKWVQWFVETFRKAWKYIIYESSIVIGFLRQY